MTKLDDLPLFAGDREIAEAIVGKRDAEKWMKERLPTLAQKAGFPAIDAFHGGRAVPLVKRFYENYLGLPVESAKGKPDGQEDDSAWNKRKRRGSSG
ncbi:conserved hypothetical protein [Mesorhizobium plurifarium]|uniref:Uncharacterized protein n=1 Tax=Mesorhizobium plurifarium TaxID=69974 RepID=A0A090EAI3_MESPL|nr:conserved hypothetical protein [Mesorhizobium plurifarium]